MDAGALEERINRYRTTTAGFMSPVRDRLALLAAPA